jgi:hypothetical protein
MAKPNGGSMNALSHHTTNFISIMPHEEVTIDWGFG